MQPDFPSWTRRRANAVPRGPESIHLTLEARRSIGKCSGRATEYSFAIKPVSGAESGDTPAAG